MAIITLRLRDLESYGLSTSSNYQAKILHISTSALLSLGLIYHCYNPFFILASTQIQTFQPISTSSCWRKSLTYYWAIANQAGMLEHKFSGLLTDWRLFRSDHGGARGGLPRMLEMKTIGRAAGKRWEDDRLDVVRPYSWDVNIIFNWGSQRAASLVAKLKKKV